MEKRLELHEKLCSVLGTRNVYFQPPESIKLKYPCIVYKRATYDVRHADDAIYSYKSQYDVTAIFKDPDSELPLSILGSFSMIAPGASFTVDNLYHYVFKLYY